MANQGVAGYCPNCNAPFAPGAQACGNCGMSLVQAAAGQPTQPQPGQPPQQQPPPQQPPPQQPPPQQPPPQQPPPQLGAPDYGQQPQYGQPQYQQPDYAAGQYQQPAYGQAPPPPPDKKGGKTALIIVVALLVLLAAAVGGYFLFVRKPKPVATPATAATKAPTLASPTPPRTASASPSISPTIVGGVGNPTALPADLAAQQDLLAALASEKAFVLSSGGGLYTDDGNLLLSYNPSISYGHFQGPKDVSLGTDPNATTVCIGAEGSSGKRYWIGVVGTQPTAPVYYSTSNATVDYGAGCTAATVATWQTTPLGWS